MGGDLEIKDALDRAQRFDVERGVVGPQYPQRQFRQSAAQWNVVGIQREQNSALGMLETVGKESEPTVPTLFDKNWQNRFGIDYPGVRHEPEGVRRGIGGVEDVKELLDSRAEIGRFQRSQRQMPRGGGIPAPAPR